MTFPEQFLRVAGFGEMTHLNLRVVNDTWTSLGDEFEMPMDHFWGQKLCGMTFPEHLRVSRIIK